MKRMPVLVAAVVLAALVLVPAAAPADTLVASDAFSRVAAGSWGAATVGGAWSGTGSAYSVDGSRGAATLAPGQAADTFLTSVSQRDVDLSFDVGASRTPAGGPLTVGLATRRQATGNHYRAEVSVMTDGSVRVQLYKRTAPGTLVSLTSPVTITGTRVSSTSRATARFQVTGANPTVLAARVWPAGTAEPSTWATQATDTTSTLQGSGAVGVTTFSSAKATAKITALVDNVAARSLAPAPPTTTSTTTTPSTTTTTTTTTSTTTTSTTTTSTTTTTTTTTTAPPPTTTTTSPPGSGWTTQRALTRPYAETSPWNTPIPATATYTPTATFAGERGNVDAEKTSVPVWFSAPTDPLLTFTVRNTRVMTVRGPADLTTQPNPDRSVIIVDLASATTYELWHVTRTGSTTFTAEAGTQTSLDGTGFGSFTASGSRVRAGIRAAGASFLGGLITGENFQSGRIDHALGLSLANDDLFPAFVPPAIDIDGNAASTYTGTLPMGTRLGIPPGTPRPAGLSPAGTMVWDAFVTYGGYAVDRAPRLFLYADARTVSEADVDPLRNAALPGGSDLQKIIPYLQVVTSS